jgi:hypothetical protein
MLEMVLVMAIILIVGALASPLVFQGLDGQTKVNAAADIVRARWAECRTHAIEEGRMYQFGVIPNSGKFKIEPFKGGLQDQGYLSPSPESGPDGGSMGGAPANPGYVIEDKLPTGVRFGTKDVSVDPNSEESDGGDYVVVAVFLPNGRASEDVEIIFGSKGSANVTLHLRELTGAATTVRPKSEGNN